MEGTSVKWSAVGLGQRPASAEQATGEKQTPAGRNAGQAVGPGREARPASTVESTRIGLPVQGPLAVPVRRYLSEDLATPSPK